MAYWLHLSHVFKLMTFIRNIIILCLAFRTVSTLSAQPFKTVGYLLTDHFETIESIRLDQLTHLNIAFANPDMEGNLMTDGVSIDEVIKKAHTENVEVFISLAGASAQLADWQDRITPDGRPTFIHGIIRYVYQHQLQGVDVDLEWDNVNDDYSGFVVALKDSLAHHGFKLTAALPGGYRYPQITSEALAAFDWINLMVYDLTGPWTPNDPGPHSPYSYAVSSIDYWTQQGLTKDRMTLGVPFYGYDFTNPDHIVSVTYGDMVTRDSAYAQTDQVGAIYYNGLPTITDKTKLALHETGGVMIWEIGQDQAGSLSLLRRIAETISAFNLTSNYTATDISKITLYPNPANDVLQIKMEDPKNLKITLYSQSLRLLRTSHYMQQSELSVDLSLYPKGTYFVIVESGSLKRTFTILKL